MEKEQKGSSFLSQDYLDMILENVQDGIYITDSEANTVYLNHSYELISGLQKTEMLGKNMRELVEGGVVSMSGTLIVLETGESVTSEQSFRTGKRAVITSTPIFDDVAAPTHIIMVVTIVREITEIYSIRRELQRLELQNRQYANELEHIRGELSGNIEYVAQDEGSVKMLNLAERVSMVENPVLISGEQGVGKEKMARLIHRHSRRCDFPFLRINFSVVPKDDPVSYLFGYEDANQEYQMGILESADGGTVYLEELTDIPKSICGRILALLKDGTCVMGDGILRRLDVRFIVGSTHSLGEMREYNLVEKDILDCFSLFPMELRPLRERRDDIIPLVQYFLHEYNQKTGEKKYFSRDCFQKLLEYSWPGNVHEVEVQVQRAAIVSSQDEISCKDLMMETKKEKTGADPGEVRDYIIVLDDKTDLKMEVAKLESDYMKKAFMKYQNIREAADCLGMDSSTFVRKRQRYEKLGLMTKEKKKN